MIELAWIVAAAHQPDSNLEHLVSARRVGDLKGRPAAPSPIVAFSHAKLSGGAVALISKPAWCRTAAAVFKKR